MPVTTDEFKRGMRHFPAVVTLITTGRAPDRSGLTATAAMSLTADPPQLVIAVNHTASAYPLILQNRCFVVNVLQASESRLAEVFAGRDGRNGEERFAEGRWTELVTGSPVLEHAVVSFDCRLVDELRVATHSLLVGLVEAVRLDPDAEPLLHAQGKWATLLPVDPD